ncbi:Na+/H+ antiporter NhaA [Chitinophaga pinensis]|uniref:Na(+)/H(+) antiporter NhaA n=1 Tax=Chitinophaga pinensis (strain ATCC 43595 / DSM 2588 / LMG 13176 / NBRC 15968 / NCIMB 11800 / UQM 2034) TaxID=485918 RepID=A0A979GA23_CHIPD|nr:Na+/H+ antiporter NhaA [Chitinophaga pinensis]ACU63600.1 Na+/H+ antiporter NhaA [Chitinophaga pinensis DSM 2588]
MIKRLLSPIYEFLHDSRAVGIVLIICTAVSLILANSPWQQSYLAWWDTAVHIPIPALHLPHTLLHWINDGLMVPFFFLVGMEIKREVTIGELSSLRQSLLPIIAALGGMLCPAIIFALFNGNTPFANGWGIPMATDIAFSLGILSLLGDRVPLSLKIFLTALAIIDDLGAIVTIAIFYSAGIQTGYLIAAAGVMGVLILLNVFKVRRLWCYFIPGLILWYCIYNSGIHATIAGVLLASCMPLSKISRLIHWLHDPVNFVIMPVFALSNTAIVFPPDIWQAFTSSISYGILAGLVIGKPLGIFLFSFLATRLRLATLPDGANWPQMLGIGMIAGIGFTMSIFIATLAYTEADWQITSKIAIIAASLFSGLIGYVFLRRSA